MKKEEKTYKSFKEFYPYYLSQHKKPLTKLFHFFGTSCALLIFLSFIYDIIVDTTFKSSIESKISYSKIGYAIVCGYFFAWISHAFIEVNKPATFTYPIWSLIGDFKMWYEII